MQFERTFTPDQMATLLACAMVTHGMLSERNPHRAEIVDAIDALIANDEVAAETMRALSGEVAPMLAKSGKETLQ